MSESGGRRPRWPEWLESLRPDEVTRARLVASIRREAAGRLQARRRTDWWSVTAGWTSVLAPLAAAVTLVFAGLAYRAQTTVVEVALESPRVEALVGSPLGESLPAVLTDAGGPEVDDVLALAVYSQDAR